MKRLAEEFHCRFPTVRFRRHAARAVLPFLDAGVHQRVSYLRRWREMPNAPAATHALKVLRLLARHAAAAARRRRSPATSSSRAAAPTTCSSVLADEGFVVHLPEQRRYGLGVAAYEIGCAYVRQEPLRWIAQTVLTRLVNATTHNAHLAVLHGRDVLYVIEERAPNRPELVTDVGVRLPAHLTASGLAMLAALPPSPARRAVPRPPRAHATQRGRPHLADAVAQAPGHGAGQRLRRGGRVRHARASPASRPRCSTTLDSRSRRSR